MPAKLDIVAELDSKVSISARGRHWSTCYRVQLQAEKDRATELRALLDSAMTPAPVPSLLDRLVRLRRLLSSKTA